jgi:STE24 endopeptidase
VDRVRLDPTRQEQARELARARLWLRAASLAISVTGLVLLGPVGLAGWLAGRAEQASSLWPLQVAVFFAVLGLAAGLLDLPLSYCSGFVLAHRYGLSTQSFRAWLIDLTKAAAIGVLLGGIAIEAVYAFLRLTPDTWWIWTGIFFSLLTVGLTTLAPVLILPLFYRLTPLRDPDLEADVRRLAARAETQVADVAEIDLSDKTTAANAAVIGMGRTRKIVLGDTLLERFGRDEVEVVVAHELGHHVHRDLLRGVVAGSALSLAGFYVANLALHTAVSRLHFQGVWDLAAFPVLAVALGGWGWIAARIELALSRWMEARADAYALELTGKSGAFIDSEIRLTNQNLAWYRPPAWLELLLYSHPAPWRRVAMGERYQLGETREPRPDPRDARA